MLNNLSHVRCAALSGGSKKSTRLGSLDRGQNGNHPKHSPNHLARASMHIKYRNVSTKELLYGSKCFVSLCALSDRRF